MHGLLQTGEHMTENMSSTGGLLSAEDWLVRDQVAVRVVLSECGNSNRNVLDAVCGFRGKGEAPGEEVGGVRATGTERNRHVATAQSDPWPQRTS